MSAFFPGFEFFRQFIKTEKRRRRLAGSGDNVGERNRLVEKVTGDFQSQLPVAAAVRAQIQNQRGRVSEFEKRFFDLFIDRRLELIEFNISENRRQKIGDELRRGGKRAARERNFKRRSVGARQAEFELRLRLARHQSRIR